MKLSYQEFISMKRLILFRFEEDGKVEFLPGVINPGSITLDGNFISIGGFYSDRFKGYFPIQHLYDIHVSVIKEFPLVPEVEDSETFWEKLQWLLE